MGNLGSGGAPGSETKRPRTTGKVTMASKKNTSSFDEYAKDFAGNDFKDIVDNVVGWIVPKENLIVHGILKGMKYNSANENYFYFVELKKDTAVISADGEKTELTAPSGSLVGLSERHKLRALREYVDGEGEFMFAFESKQKLTRGRTMWSLSAIKIRGRKNPDFKPPAKIDVDAPEEPF